MHMRHRTNTQIAERRQQIATRYLRGETQAGIAADLGIDQATVSRDLVAVRAAWLASSVRDFDTAVAQELAKIDEIESEYWQAWERSKMPKEATLTEKVEGKDSRSRARVQREHRDGNPAYLDGVLKCIERRCKLLGLDAPERFVIRWEDLTPEQLDRLAAGDPPQKVLSA